MLTSRNHPIRLFGQGVKRRCAKETGKDEEEEGRELRAANEDDATCASVIDQGAFRIFETDF